MEQMNTEMEQMNTGKVRMTTTEEKVNEAKVVPKLESKVDNGMVRPQGRTTTGR